MNTEDDGQDEPWFLRPEFDGRSESVAKLQAIMDGPLVGEVEGVRFDFRHDQLPSTDEWHAPKGATPFGVVFPWDRACFNGDEALAADDVTDGGTQRGWSAQQIYPGDLVRVRAVHVWGRRPKELVEDRHDFERYGAFLEVQRADGSTEPLRDPIVWNARDAMGPWSPYTYAGDDGYDEYVGDFRVSLDKVRLRFDRCFLKPRGAKGLAWLSLADAALEALASDQDGSFPPGPKLPLSEGELTYYLDMAVAAGYGLARAEMAPVIEKVRTRTNAAVAARRALSGPILDAAKVYIRANPRTSLTACARHLSGEFSRDQRQVERLISHLFGPAKTGTGVRERRPLSWLVDGKFSSLW